MDICKQSGFETCILMKNCDECVCFMTFCAILYHVWVSTQTLGVTTLLFTWSKENLSI